MGEVQGFLKAACPLQRQDQRPLLLSPSRVHNCIRPPFRTPRGADVSHGSTCRRSSVILNLHYVQQPVCVHGRAGFKDWLRTTGTSHQGNAPPPLHRQPLHPLILATAEVQPLSIGARHSQVPSLTRDALNTLKGGSAAGIQAFGAVESARPSCTRALFTASAHAAHLQCLLDF